MASHATYLSIFNFTNEDINITVTETDNYDWDGVSRPDHNFNNVTIASEKMKREREELNASARSAWYRMNISLLNGDEITFRNDQHDALGSFSREYKLEGSSSGKYNLHQEAADNENKFFIFNKKRS
uniref:Uncharacterized protein n=1 Tax=Candidatus Kentrum sp. MB TaxID=2138164 RepID=A0A451BB05_9GAMM|nr:MAG: hypothetical protein BECKMB1821G_GA0114241_10258 [Candidatus Kentron sp. MB]VFK31381.1 MAG: hypothetical protein BECKMB1821I_GA0114274_10239 [Candidatus Kentron sp. MB]VFK75457.1 MAG: hypothetical protein BECKMB1821H_GA0114242_10239 [Candidatus Kentron sp. MB]